MRKICEELARTELFRGLREDTFEPYCLLTNIRLVWKGEILIHQGDVHRHVGVVTDGQLAVQKYTGSGEAYTLGLLGPGEMIGGDMVFATDPVSPVTVEAVMHSKVILLTHELIRDMIRDRIGLEQNYLRVLSDRIHRQNQRISLLSQKTLRQKIAFYLLELSDPGTDASGPVRVRLPASKEVVARLLAMPRPSFSRELIHMEQDGLVRVHGRDIEILSREALERDVLENLAF